jgi:hypothetical protein
MTCDIENGSWDAGHDWEYVTTRLGGEPIRVCGCGRVEAYYCDDLDLEIEMGVAPARFYAKAEDDE